MKKKVTREEYNNIPERFRKEYEIITYTVYIDDDYFNEFEDVTDAINIVNELMNNGKINRLTVYL